MSQFLPYLLLICISSCSSKIHKLHTSGNDISEDNLDDNILDTAVLAVDNSTVGATEGDIFNISVTVSHTNWNRLNQIKVRKGRGQKKTQLNKWEISHLGV